MMDVGLTYVKYVGVMARKYFGERLRSHPGGPVR